MLSKLIRWQDDPADLLGAEDRAGEEEPERVDAVSMIDAQERSRFDGEAELLEDLPPAPFEGRLAPLDAAAGDPPRVAIGGQHDEHAPVLVEQQAPCRRLLAR